MYEGPTGPCIGTMDTWLGGGGPIDLATGLYEMGHVSKILMVLDASQTNTNHCRCLIKKSQQCGLYAIRNI